MPAGGIRPARSFSTTLLPELGVRRRRCERSSVSSAIGTVPRGPSCASVVARHAVAREHLAAGRRRTAARRRRRLRAHDRRPDAAPRPPPAPLATRRPDRRASARSRAAPRLGGRPADGYALVKPVRPLVTVKLPSSWRGEMDPVAVGRVVEIGDEVVAGVAGDARRVQLPQILEPGEPVQRAEGVRRPALGGHRCSAPPRGAAAPRRARGRSSRSRRDGRRDRPTPARDDRSGTRCGSACCRSSRRGRGSGTRRARSSGRRCGSSRCRPRHDLRRGRSRAWPGRLRRAASQEIAAGAHHRRARTPVSGSRSPGFTCWAVCASRTGR